MLALGLVMTTCHRSNISANARYPLDGLHNDDDDDDDDNKDGSSAECEIWFSGKRKNYYYIF